MKVQIIVKKSDAAKFAEHMLQDKKVCQLQGKTMVGNEVTFEVTYK